ncbi:unnamed protein product [Absidia cylindrospora]
MGLCGFTKCLEPTNLTQWSQMEFAIDMGQDSTSSSLETPPLKAIIPTSSLLSQQQLLQQHQLQEQQQIRQLQQQQNGTLDASRRTQQQQQRQQNPTSSKSQQSDTSPHQMSGSEFPQQDQQQPPVSSARSQPPHLGTLVSPPDIVTMFQQQQQHLPLRTPNSNSSGSSSTTENTQLPFGFHIPSTPGPPPAPPPPSMTLPGVTPNLAMSSLDHHQQQQQQRQWLVDSQRQYDRHPPTDTMRGFCIHWCPNRTATAMMAVGLGKEYGAKIFKHDGHDKWQPGEILPGHTNQVNDISWAPSMGRTYQLIATACKDHFWTLPCGNGSRIWSTSSRGVSSGMEYHGYHFIFFR